MSRHVVAVMRETRHIWYSEEAFMASPGQSNLSFLLPAGGRGRAAAVAASVSAVTLILALSSPADATPSSRPGGDSQAALTSHSLSTVFPGCSWPVETTPTTANIAAPDPYATYWLTPFLAKTGYSITIKGTFPTSRFVSFVVYNDSFLYFTNTVHGKSVQSDLSDYQITPDRGSQNPWRTSRPGKRQRFTIRITPQASAAQQKSENAIPMIDQDSPADPAGPPGVGYVIFRTYIPSGGNSTVRLPTMTVTRDGHRTTLPQCASSASAKTGIPALERAVPALKKRMASSGAPATCTSGCGDPELQYFGPSLDEKAGLFPNPVNGYVSMNFTPRKGYVVVTHGKAPSSPVDAGSGKPGDSIGAHPVPWIRPKFQVRYWSISNYVDKSPDPVVEIGRGSKAIFGGTPDYLTTLKNGYYTVVSSLPADKPSASSLKASAATWIPTSASHPTTPEFQLLRNMLSQENLYPEGFAFISPPASPSETIPPATVRKQMGAYYPQTAECTVQTFETQGWAGCLAASTGS
jgi:hypothetical protein